MEIIKSSENKKFKSLKKLLTKKEREKTKTFLIEGKNIIEEAKKYNKILTYITDDINKIEDNVFYLDKKLKESLSSLKNSNEDIALVKYLEEKEISANTILLIDNVRDPSNLGTILRTCLAFGVKDIVLSENTVDLYNSKTLRASEGAIFSLNILRDNLLNFISKYKEYKVLSTSLKANDLSALDNTKKIIVIGNEGNGVSKEILDISDEYLKIPIKNIDSLNVAIATSIILYENSK
ncbi:MAG: RNA methyltransferase [Clostridiales bacterium]|jgi:hypothetical protein|nr:RNA methyltransferase [Clostridiales bacterium]